MAGRYLVAGERLNPKDPPGTHVILIVAGALAPSQADARVKSLLDGIGKPPDAQPQSGWHSAMQRARPRDDAAGKSRTPEMTRIPEHVRWLVHYLEQIQTRLDGPDFQTLHAIAVSSKR